MRWTGELSFLLLEGLRGSLLRIWVLELTVHVGLRGEELPLEVSLLLLPEERICSEELLQLGLYVEMEARVVKQLRKLANFPLLAGEEHLLH